MNIKLTCALLSLAFAASSHLNAGANFDIVTISGQQVMTESETGKGIRLKLEEEQKKLATPLQKEEQKLQDQEKKLIAQKDTLEKDFAEFEKTSKMLSASAREEKKEALAERAQKFDDAKRELERNAQKFQAEARKIEAKLNELYQKEMNRLDSEVKKVIKKIAAEKNWKIVLMEESVIYADPKISQTSLVKAKLDEETKAANQSKKDSLKVEQDIKSLKA
ncbi:OmpH family outer membrane protein [Candidatus Babeliales bacterium]|nr:OmpH family outer membrane protein [Candidatus Babeliales bacterium]